MAWRINTGPGMSTTSPVFTVAGARLDAGLEHPLLVTHVHEGGHQPTRFCRRCRRSMNASNDVTLTIRLRPI